MVDDGGSARKQLGEGSITARYHSVRQRLRAVPRVLQDEDRPAAQGPCRERALLVERAGVRGQGGAEGEHDWRRAEVQEADQIGWQPSAAILVIPRETGDEGLGGPIGLFVHQQFREEGKMEQRRMSIRQWVELRDGREADLSSEAMPGRRQPTHCPFEEPTKRPPEAGAKKAQAFRGDRQTCEQRWINQRIFSGSVTQAESGLTTAKPRPSASILWR